MGSVGAMSSAAQAQSVTRTPLSAPVELTGMSGGREASVCGNIDTAAAQVVQVSEAFASLKFKVQSTGDYTLLINGPNGFSECVFAHNYDGGVIQSPGLLNEGSYRVYVGDRRGESHPYTLSITQ
ncbi:MAG: hypothetical protein WBA76_02690 [Phormidesmis sp.]